MGTHPIFESDFDCLTEKAKKMLTPVARQSLTQVRNSSGKLKEPGIRLKSIRNIEKITKTMKMISSAKFAKASKTIGPARAFGEGAQAVDANTEGSTKELYMAITSDRGLCGALHTTICREVEAEMNAAAEEKALVTYGDKGRAYFVSKGPQNMLLEFKEAGRNDPTFEDASFMAQEILASGFEFESGIIKFNHFASAMKQVPTNVTMHSVSSLSNADLSIYDSVDDQVLSDYAEFNMTALIFALIKENFVAEQGARMVSMDGASKNAGDMINKLNLSFNRMRQAVITTELSEIISGMVAIE